MLYHYPIGLKAHPKSDCGAGRYWHMPLVAALVILAILGVSAHAGPAHPCYREGEVLVTFRHKVSRTAMRKAVGCDAHIAREYRHLSARRRKTYLHVKSDTETTEQLLARFGKHPNVESVSPNYIRQLFAALPKDQYFADAWGLHNTGQVVEAVSGMPDADIDFPEAREMARPGAPDVVVGVIDTGCDYTHPDLVGNIWVNTGEMQTNNVDDDGNGYVDDYHGYDFAGDGAGGPDSDPMDIDILPGHGTHVAGTVSAVQDNADGIPGVAGSVKVMILKASSDGVNISAAGWIEALDYAIAMRTSGVNIVAVNTSFGAYGYTQAERDAIEEAGNAGIVLCAAAGNDGVDNDVSPVYPASYDLSNIIAVAATGQDDALWSGSNYGDTNVDIGAPGTSIISTTPAHRGTDAFVSLTTNSWSGIGMAYAGTTTGITAIAHDCGLGYPGDFPAEVSGNVALVLRGEITFGTKTLNAKTAGARAILIYNNEPGTFAGTLETPRRHIPSMSLSQADGLQLLAMSPGTVTVVNAPNPNLVYGYSTGSSMASPHAAGAVAVMACNHPGDSVEERIARIVDNVDPVPALSGLVATGGRLNLWRSTDSDGDSLPDWWELDFVTNVSVMASTTDVDGDCSADLDEYLAGTHPTNGGSFLGMSGMAPGTNGSAMIVTWQSVSNKCYTISCLSDLVSGSYAPLASNLPAVPPLNVYTDATAGAGPRYYRITLEE